MNIPKKFIFIELIQWEWYQYVSALRWSPFYTALPKGFYTPSRQYKKDQFQNYMAQIRSIPQLLNKNSLLTKSHVWVGDHKCMWTKEGEDVLHVYLLSRGPLCSSQLCREKSHQHASFTLSADTNEPAQLISNCRAPGVVKVRHSTSTSS